MTWGVLLAKPINFNGLLCWVTWVRFHGWSIYNSLRYIDKLDKNRSLQLQIIAQQITDSPAKNNCYKITRTTSPLIGQYTRAGSECHTQKFSHLSSLTYSYFIKQTPNGFPCRILWPKHLGCFSTFEKLKNTRLVASIVFMLFENIPRVSIQYPARKTIWYFFTHVCSLDDVARST